MEHILQMIYNRLFSDYGAQGWWPIGGKYHPKNYKFPNSKNQAYEICIGAILTQSISWSSVQKSLVNLKKLDAINPEKLMKLDDDTLKKAIMPSGYFNQKARKLREFTKFFITLNNRTPTREELLKIWGIGNETADSILLYAYKVPTFVVDAYTRRIFGNLGKIDPKADYDVIKTYFESNLAGDYRTFQEYHALIVEHAKRYYSGKKEKYYCPLQELVGKDQVLLH